jgi:DNA-binding PadR family transcriptional regulator
MTNSELVLLSLVAEAPRHGYELEKVIEERGMRNWTEIAFSSIYFLLNKLVKDELIAAQTQPAAGRGPAKKVYTLLPAGADALRQGVREGLANAFPGDRSFLLGLSCLPMLPHAEVLAALAERQAALYARQSELQHHPALNLPGFPTHVTAMFTYSLSLLNAEIDWLNAYIRQLEKES